jgi:hypothetical protein
MHCRGVLQDIRDCWWEVVDIALLLEVALQRRGLGWIRKSIVETFWENEGLKSDTRA